MTPHSGPPNSTEDPESRPEATVEDIVMRYFEDSALWPVLIVIVAHIAAVVGFALMLAVADRNFAAMGAVAVFLYASFAIMRWEWRQRNALRTLSITIVIIWVLSAGIAYYGQRLHFL